MVNPSRNLTECVNLPECVNHTECVNLPPKLLLASLRVNFEVQCKTWQGPVREEDEMPITIGMGFLPRRHPRPSFPRISGHTCIHVCAGWAKKTQNCWPKQLNPARLGSRPPILPNSGLFCLVVQSGNFRTVKQSKRFHKVNIFGRRAE